MIATTLVASVMFASLVYAVTATSASPGSHLIPAMTAGRIVFSLRNTSTAAITIDSITKATPVSTACIPYIDPMFQGPCQYNVMTSAGMQMLTINFNVAGSAMMHDKVDLQPIEMSFASQFCTKR